jgi:2-polyprenyl-3-methyl-5-hydroxy-6-metoxy-1,4-benzoquinol methylase
VGSKLIPLTSGALVMKDDVGCRICGAETVEVGSKTGTFHPVPFHLRHCLTCRFSFVSNPWTDYEKIYSAEYYAGKGADPLVDYEFELDHPDQTVRLYEWRGILNVVESLTTVAPETNWLDFGCGNGGLVRYCLAQKKCRIVGFEDGWIRDKAAGLGIPYIGSDRLDAMSGTFDVVTAIEVLEHVEDPLEVLKRLRRLLKPGGLLFCTTGNARPFRDRLLSWRYVRPEIHISFFEPETLARAMTLSGFRPQFTGYMGGFTDIIRFKVLKNLGVRRRSLVGRAVPWSVLARLIDRRLRVMAHPVGWAAPASHSPCGSQRDPSVEVIEEAPFQTRPTGNLVQ